MNTRSEHEENRRAPVDALHAGSDVLSYLSSRFVNSDIGDPPMIGNQVVNQLGIASLLRQKQYDEQQLLVSRLILRQQQQQRTDALLAAASIHNPMIGQGAHTHPLFADNLEKRNSDPAYMLQHEQLSQQIELLRAEAELTRHGRSDQRTDTIMPEHHKKIQTTCQSKLNDEDGKKLKSMPDIVQAVEKDSKGEVDDELAGEATAGENANTTKGTVNESFPQKLYRMLEEAETNGMKDVVSFLPHGKVFVIHKPRKFVLDLIPKYFSTGRMSSFQRQLNLYGFRRVKGGAEKGGYYHDFFFKGKPELCMKIKRKKARAKVSTSATASSVRTRGLLSGVVGSVLDNGTVPNQLDVNTLQTYARIFPGISGLGIDHANDGLSMMMPMGLNGMSQSAFRSPLSTEIQPTEQSAETFALLLTQIQEKEQRREQLIKEMRRSRLGP